MITLADPLPDDLEAAHQLIRELLKSLAQQVHLNEKLQHQLEQLLRQRDGPKGERIDPAQLLLFAREILEQAEAAPTPAPTPEPAPAPTPAPSAAQKKGHGRKPLPASLPRVPVLHDVPPEQRTCPDCGADAHLHRPGSPRATRIHPRPPGHPRTHPPQVRLPGLPGQRRDRRRAPRADRQGPARPGAAGLRRRQQICRSLAALSPRGNPRSLGRRVVAVDDVRLDGHDRRSAQADRRSDAEEDPQLQGRPERRHDGAGAGPRRQGDQDRPALGLRRRPRPSLRGLSLHAGPQRHRAPGDLQGLPGLSPGRRLFGLRRPVQVGRDYRGRLHDARATEVLRGADRSTRNGPIRRWHGSACSTTSNATPRSARPRTTRPSSRSGTNCETSDRVRSSTSFTPGWKPSSPRFCPRVRSAKRSSMP